MEIRDIRSGDIEQVRELLLANGWKHRVGNAPKFSRLLANSQRSVVASESGHVVGFVRSLCDGESNGYLSMLVVDPKHRGKGVGRALVTTIVGDNRDITWMLRADREGSQAFFARLGFTMSTVAMELTRHPRHGA